MRMRPHIDAAASPEFDRPHMIQEHEGPTVRFCAEGSARRTSNPPRSLLRGTTTVSIWLAPSSDKVVMVISPN